MHITQRPYQCDQCFKPFQNQTQLRKHRQFQDKDKVFNCNKCSDRFENSCVFKDHMDLDIHQGTGTK